MFLDLSLDVLSSFQAVLSPFYREKQSFFNKTVWFLVMFIGFTFLEIVSSDSKSCDYRLTKSPGVINSPNYPNKYPNSMTCSWKIQVPEYDKILLLFIIFEVESGSLPTVCDKDFVEVIDGTRSLGKFCNSGKKYPSGTIKSSSNTMTLIFKSDPFTSNKALFHATYEREPCGGLLNHGLKGEFSSPGYPGPYPASKKCIWRITVPKDKVIKLYFLDFALDPSSKCNLDYIRAVDGLNTTSPLIGHYCAKRVHPTEIRSTSYQMMVEFRSFKPTLSTGFHAFYEAEPHCGGLLKEEKGSFTSPGYPHGVSTLKDTQECIWTIEVKKGMVISIVFDAFDIRTLNLDSKYDSDYVEIIDGPDIASPSLGRFCENDPKEPLRSTGNNMVVKLHRSISSAGVGFAATYTTVDPKNPYDKCEEASDELLFRCNNRNYIQCQWKCDGTDDCGDSSDEANCVKDQSKSINTRKVRNYVIILVSITGSAVAIALVVFIVDRLRRKRRSRATRRRRRRTRRNHCREADLQEPSSPPPTYDFAVAISDCCDTNDSPPPYTVTPFPSCEVSEGVSSNQTEAAEAEQTVSADQGTENQEEITNNMDSMSLGESPPSNDTTPLIV